MTDKEKIREAIEKRYEYWKEKEFNSHSIESEARMSECQHLLLIVDSLSEEPASEDLDYLVISLEETIGTSPHSREVIKEHLQKAAEWQKKQMMKDAVDAFVNTYENTDDSNYVEFVTEQSPHKFKETEKCKLIIVKEN